MLDLDSVVLACGLAIEMFPTEMSIRVSSHDTEYHSSVGPTLDPRKNCARNPAG
jgi:hypothetical protein